MTIDTKDFEFRNIFNDNPFLFMADFEQAVKDGYRVVNNLQGYPRLQGMLKEVRMFRSDTIKSDVTSDAEKQTEVVIDYDPVIFLMRSQAIILAGYEVDLDCHVYGIHFNSPYQCTFRRTEEADVATVEAMLQEMPGVDIEPDDVVESVIAKPQPKRTSGRKRRSSSSK